MQHLRPPDVSEISSAVSENTDTDVASTAVKRTIQPDQPSTSKEMSPCVTIDVTEESISDDDSDEDYEPSVNVTLRPNNMFDLAEVTLEEQEFGPEETEAADLEDGQDMQEDTGSGIIRIKDEDDVHLMTKDDTCLVYKKCLLKLASTKVKYTCKVKGCSGPVSFRTENIGSALYIYWECTKKHEAHRWCSQPVLNRRLHGGDLQISSAILTSGNNFAKCALFAKFLKLYFPSTSKFTAIQRKYLVPTISTFWKEQQRDIIENLQGESIIALGDGRNDSPGHSAQYCTYSIMDNVSKKIVSLVTMDKRETGKKSTNMEKACFLKAMEDLEENHVHVSEVVTDAHLQIGAVMKNRFPDIKHSHDIWHAAKNLGKKIVAAGQNKECRGLLEWSRDVINHFWYSCSCATDVDSFMEVWCGVVHHVVDEHEWNMSYSSNFYGSNKCLHGPIEDEHKAWLTKGSPAHTALIEIVFNKRFLSQIHYYVNFRSTAELENFNNLILMYSGKRFAFSPPVYRARNLLAALDYNANVDREVKRNSDGSIQQHRTFNKKSSRWSVTPVKVAKSYRHIEVLLERVVVARLRDQEGMCQPVVLDIHDPRRLSRTIAPVDPKPTAVLEEEKVSRFLPKD
uniref:Uncharacterized protein LOC111109742 n=1 Tax=Crassostrea virginica TaxID=6565 RepID=A0A8B8BE62_CRAVI|nr:uncharacterized protein LOC111109742 [Crassostrea virginica]